MADATPAVARSTAERIHQWIGFVADISLIPLFAIAVLETQAAVTAGEHELFEFTNLGFCLLYVAEWTMGLALAPSRTRYLLSPGRLADILSAIPFGHLFQGLRILRVLRAARLLRLIWRVKRYRGVGTRVARAVAVAVSTVLAGGLAMEIAEPQTFSSLPEALWWALVTVSTVGYGDIVPQTITGRAVATALIVFGLGLFGYVAGFMATMLEDPEDEELLQIGRRTEDQITALRAEVQSLRAALDALAAAAPRPEEPSEGSHQA